MFIVSACAWAYVRYGTLPRAAGLLYGVKPVIIAVVLLALFDLARTALKTTAAAVICATSIVLAVLGVNELLVLLAAGLLSMAPAFSQRATTHAVAGVWPLFWFFAKVGSVLYGSGYVLLAFLRADLVERWHWLTEAQLLDAIAVGQFTPGPVFTTATFIGFVLAGPLGAAAATIGIFLPSFLFVAISGPLLPHIRKSPLAGAALTGVNAASLALMAVVTWELGRSAIFDSISTFLAAGSLFLLWRYRVNSAWLVLAGGIIGLLTR